MTNAGQANAATGDLGYKDAVETAEVLAKALGIKPDDVLLQSTGREGAAMHISVGRVARVSVAIYICVALGRQKCIG